MYMFVSTKGTAEHGFGYLTVNPYAPLPTVWVAVRPEPIAILGSIRPVAFGLHAPGLGIEGPPIRARPGRDLVTAAGAVASVDADGMIAVASVIHINAEVLSMLSGVAIPLVVALITKLHASSA